jgi:WD40 repeat protein
MAFHPSGDRIVSTATDNRVLVWDPLTGGQMSVLRGHRADVDALTASADGAAILTGDWLGEVRVWDWDAQDIRSPRMALERWRVPRVSQAALVRSASMLVAAWDMPSLLVWNVADLAPVAALDCFYCSCVACPPDGKTLVAGNKQGRLWVFDAVTWSADSIVAHTAPIVAVAIDAGGERIATVARDSTIKLWSRRGLQLLDTCRGHAGGASDVEFSPDGAALVSAGADHTLRLWTAEGGRELAVLHGHSGPVLDVAFDASGRRLASTSTDRTIRLWDVEAGASRDVIEPRAIANCIAWAPDGSRLAAGGRDGILRVFDPATQREIVGLHGHSSGILSVRFDGKLLVSTSTDGTVKVWDGAPPPGGRNPAGG